MNRSVLLFLCAIVVAAALAPAEERSENVKPIANIPRTETYTWTTNGHVRGNAHQTVVCKGEMCDGYVNEPISSRGTWGERLKLLKQDGTILVVATFFDYSVNLSLSPDTFVGVPHGHDIFPDWDIPIEIRDAGFKGNSIYLMLPEQKKNKIKLHKERFWIIGTLTPAPPSAK